MAVRRLMNAEELKAWILRRLGYPQLKVELDGCHLDDAVELARRWFTAKKGVIKRALMRLNAGQNEYDLPDEVDVVTEVVFASSPFDLSLIFAPYILLDEKVPYDVFAAPQSVGLYSTFTQTLQYIEVAKRVIGAEKEWSQEDRKLLIWPTPRDSDGLFFYYKTFVDAIEKLGERDHDLVKRYALAKAKEDLGRIRSKYDSYPAAGGNVNLDGATLLEEARLELEALEEEISASAMPMGFVTG